MHDQPRFKPLAQSDFYADLRSARPPVEGTVARGQLHEDTYFYTGKFGNNPGDYMPFPVTMDVLSRGRERFNIYARVPLARWRWQRNDRAARFSRTTVLSHERCAKRRWGISLT